MFNTRFQGVFDVNSIEKQSPIDDTMIDIILAMIGTGIGCVILNAYTETDSKKENLITNHHSTNGL